MRSISHVLAGNPCTPPPVWLMRQAGRYLPEYRAVRAGFSSFIEFCLSPEAAARVTLQPVERFGLDAAIIFKDILLVPYALGQDVTFVQGEGPRLSPLGEKGVWADHLVDTDFEARLAPVGQSLRLVAARLPDHVALFGFAGCPWTVACYMVHGQGKSDFSIVREMALAKPQAFDALIDVLTEKTVAYLSLQIQAGIHVYQLFESWAEVLVHHDHAFQRWVIEPAARIMRRLRQRFPAVPGVGFVKTTHAPSLEAYVRGVEPQGLGLCHGVDLHWAQRVLQPQCALQGAIDPQILVRGGRDLAQAVVDHLEVFGQGPYIANLGHGIVPETPPENVAALVSYVRRPELAWACLRAS